MKCNILVRKGDDVFISERASVHADSLEAAARIVSAHQPAYLAPGEEWIAVVDEHHGRYVSLV